MAFTCKFRALKDPDGRLYGFELVSVPRTGSAEFVAGLGQALKDRSSEADIWYGDRTIHFRLNSETHVEQVSVEDDQKFDDLFRDPEVMWFTKRAGGIIPGFARHAINRMKGQR